MKSKVEQLNQVQYRLSVEVPASEVDNAFASALRRLQKKAHIQGFRPGKAPVNVLRKLYGQHLAVEVHEDLIKRNLQTALTEQTLRPIAAPVVDTNAVPAQGQDFAFSAVVDILPTLNFDGYKGLSVTYDEFSAKPETEQNEIDRLCRSAAKTRVAEDGTAAAAGHLATLSHDASHDGVDIPQLRVNEMKVDLGRNHLLADLESAILGMKKGESKSVDITLPETYGDSALAGKTLRFNITLNDLSILEIPALDDELAKDFGYESKAKLLEDLAARIKSKAEEMTRQSLENALLGQLIEKHPFEVPPAMVDQVIDSMIDELQHHDQKSRAEALKNKELREHFLATAKRRTQNTLALWHIVQAEKITASDEEVKAKTLEWASQSGLTDPKQLASLLSNMEARVRENLIFEKAIDFLIANAEKSPVAKTI